MAHLFADDDNVSPYLKARRKFMGEPAWEKLIEDLKLTTTAYIGNLSFHTTEEQIYEFFSLVGTLKCVIMGLNRIDKTPCGFCFVEYFNHQDAANSKRYLNGQKLDERAIRIDLDPGFTEGRQYGRSKSGGQIRDIHREDYDPGRGGWGKKIQKEQDRVKQREQGSFKPRGRGDRRYGNKSRYFNSNNSDERPHFSQPKRQKKEEETNPRFREGDSDDEK